VSSLLDAGDYSFDQSAARNHHLISNFHVFNDTEVDRIVLGSRLAGNLIDRLDRKFIAFRKDEVLTTPNYGNRFGGWKEALEPVK